jgi:hypothetical protein
MTARFSIDINKKKDFVNRKKVLFTHTYTHKQVNNTDYNCDLHSQMSIQTVDSDLHAIV